MTKRRRGRELPPVVLVFGENENDTRAIKVLVEHLNPALSRAVRVETRRDPPSLTRTAGPRAVTTWLQKVSSVVSVDAKKRDVRAVLVHQDADGPDPDGSTERQLAITLGVYLPAGVLGFPVVPVQMIEAWWLLFPDALRAVNPRAWRSVKFPGGDTESMRDPKKRLQQLTRPTRREYHESDSVAIALEIGRNQLQPSGVSASWTRFAQTARHMS